MANTGYIEEFNDGLPFSSMTTMGGYWGKD